jgi:ech hydrogenase subunit D
MGQQTIKPILSSELLSETLRLKNKGYRLVAISCTSLENKADKASEAENTSERNATMELSYSFDKDYDLLSLRVLTDTEERISSISVIYPFAFLYENEIKELFGVRIKDISVDFNNTLYQIPVKTPFKKGGEE